MGLSCDGVGCESGREFFMTGFFGLACDGVLCGIFGKVLNTFQRYYGIALLCQNINNVNIIQSHYSFYNYL